MESDTKGAPAGSFDPLDRQLIQALQLDGRAPFSRLAQVLGVSDQTVARRYARLREHGGLRVLGLSTPAAFGEVRWMVRVQCAPAAAVGLAEALARREDTAWVNLCSGGAELSCTTRAHPDRQDELLLQRLPRTPSVVGISAHCVLHTYYGGPQSLALKSGALAADQVAALLAESGTPEILPEPRNAAPIALDEGDRRLLAALARDGRAGFAELAAATGWSASTVRRRLDELLGNGTLYFDLDLDWRRFGIHAMTQLWLDVAPAELAATGDALAGHPEIGYAAAVTGPSNLHAVVLSPDAQALYTYLTTRIATLPAVRRIESAPVMRTVKGPGPYLTPGRGTSAGSRRVTSAGAGRPARRGGS